MADIEDIRKKIDQLIAQKGFNYRELSLKIGRKDSYLQQYVKYGYPRRLKEIDRARLAQLLGIDDIELMDDEIIASKATGSTDKNINLISEIVKTASSEDSEMAVIDILKPQIDGTDFAHNIIGRQYISKNILADFTYSHPQDIKIVKIVSDTMKPSINPGDYVWVDISYQRPETDGLYLLASGREVNIKRLQTSPLDGSTEISCDNQQYKAYRTQDAGQLKVLGKVIGVLMHV